MKNPKVSIIVPAYNRAHLIEETLRSLLDQTYEHWECLVIDDGSQDETMNVVSAFAKADSRIHLLQRPKELVKGANSCRNLGVLHATGSYIKFLDSDDLLLAEALKEQVNWLEESPHLDMVTGYARYFREDTSNSWDLIPQAIHDRDPLTSFVREQLFFPTAGPLWRSVYLKQLDQVFDSSRHRLQDTEFHYRMLLRKMNFHYMNEPVVLYRHLNPDSITMDSQWRNLESILSYWEQVLETYSSNNERVLRNTRRHVVQNITLLIHKMISIGNDIVSRKHQLERLKYRLDKTLSSMELSLITKWYIGLGCTITVLTGRGLKFFRIPTHD